MAYSCVITNPNFLICHPKSSTLASVMYGSFPRHQLRGFKSTFEHSEVDLLRKDIRLTTFVLWPEWSYARPEDLAKNGMYFTGQKDTVKCVECSLEVTGWTTGQVPSQVHEEKSPYCPIITLIESRNIPMKVYGSKKGQCKQIKREKTTEGRYEAESSTRKTQKFLSGNEIHSNDLGVCVSSRKQESELNSLEVLEPDMTKEANRLETFAMNWCDDFPVKAAVLAKAGFYFIGPHDRVTCAFCKGNVFKWIEGDNPIEKHTRLFPNCPFVQELHKKPLQKLQTEEAKVLKNMGYDEPLIQQAFNECQNEGVCMPTIQHLMNVMYDIEDRGEDDLAQKVTSSSRLSRGATYSSDEQSAHSGAVEILGENEALKASNACQPSAEVQCVNLPCGHLVCCLKCADLVRNCPLCRTNTVGSVNSVSRGKRIARRMCCFVQSVKGFKERFFVSKVKLLKAMNCCRRNSEWKKSSM
ncbi:hypothetical protein CAPTEDRAFT_224451 [Capitella teleta]|uniref:RING-type domain-containing protein n=1 Tax=Capitella teleta TaxID=283909 RepID=R7TNA5_CAPTE|nr:hypothetical protein CAPTEDRAFT_224451 [Capitella teleta]|eukprot:ELT95124.1 hypothetical protein CAPTEDRAFT_224451 [Capitella teleta]